MDNPRYWRDRDSDFVQDVSDGFTEIYGDGEADNDATGRVLAKRPSPTGIDWRTPPFNPHGKAWQASLLEPPLEVEPFRANTQPRRDPTATQLAGPPAAALGAAATRLAPHARRGAQTLGRAAGQAGRSLHRRFTEPHGPEVPPAGAASLIMPGVPPTPVPPAETPPYPAEPPRGLDYDTEDRGSPSLLEPSTTTPPQSSADPEPPMIEHIPIELEGGDILDLQIVYNRRGNESTQNLTESATRLVEESLLRHAENILGIKVEHIAGSRYRDTEGNIVQLPEAYHPNISTGGTLGSSFADSTVRITLGERSVDLHIQTDTRSDGNLTTREQINYAKLAHNHPGSVILNLPKRLDGVILQDASPLRDTIDQSVEEIISTLVK